MDREKIFKKDPFEAFRNRQMTKRTEERFRSESRQEGSGKEITRRIIRREATRRFRRESETRLIRRETPAKPSRIIVEDYFAGQ